MRAEAAAVPARFNVRDPRSWSRAWTRLGPNFLPFADAATAADRER